MLCTLLSLFLAAAPAAFSTAPAHTATHLTQQQSEQPQLMLYYTSYCPYSQKVLKYLNKIHKTVPMVDLQNNPEAKAQLKAIGGKTQVPCLVINGHALYESDAIIEWLSKHKNALSSS